MKTYAVTIVTVVLNSAKYIEETVCSVIHQLNENIEYIIIDGGSTDGTVNIIKKYEKYLSFWESKKDLGIYDAMNKGIYQGKGDFFYFINSGDILYKLPLNDISANFESDLIVFPVKLSDQRIFYPQTGYKLKLMNTLPHQGCFYKNNSFLKYDTRFEVFADWHLNQFYKKSGKVIKIMNSPIIAFHQTNGISYERARSSEIFKVVKDNYGVIFMIISFLYFKTFGIQKRLKL